MDPPLLFSSGFAENSTYWEHIRQALNCLVENLPRNGQRSLPEDLCGVSGWRRVVSVIAGSGECPNNFRLDSVGRGIRVCRGDIIAHPLTGGRRIHRATFNVSGQSFTKVAGYVEAYQFGSADAFSRVDTRGGIDGITFSYGNSSSQYFLHVGLCHWSC